MARPGTLPPTINQDDESRFPSGLPTALKFDIRRRSPQYLLYTKREMVVESPVWKNCLRVATTDRFDYFFAYAREIQQDFLVFKCTAADVDLMNSIFMHYYKCIMTNKVVMFTRGEDMTYGQNRFVSYMDKLSRALLNEPVPGCETFRSRRERDDFGHDDAHFCIIASNLYWMWFYEAEDRDITNIVLPDWDLKATEVVSHGDRMIQEAMELSRKVINEKNMEVDKLDRDIQEKLEELQDLKQKVSEMAALRDGIDNDTYPESLPRYEEDEEEDSKMDSLEMKRDVYEPMFTSSSSTNEEEMEEEEEVIVISEPEEKEEQEDEELELSFQEVDYRVHELLGDNLQCGMEVGYNLQGSLLKQTYVRINLQLLKEHHFLDRRINSAALVALRGPCPIPELKLNKLNPMSTSNPAKFGNILECQEFFLGVRDSECKDPVAMFTSIKQRIGQLVFNKLSVKKAVKKRKTSKRTYTRVIPEESSEEFKRFKQDFQVPLFVMEYVVYFGDSNILLDFLMKALPYVEEHQESMGEFAVVDWVNLVMFCFTRGKINTENNTFFIDDVTRLLSVTVKVASSTYKDLGSKDFELRRSIECIIRQMDSAAKNYWRGARQHERMKEGESVVDYVKDGERFVKGLKMMSVMRKDSSKVEYEWGVVFRGVMEVLPYCKNVDLGGYGDVQCVFNHLYISWRALCSVDYYTFM